MKTELLIVAMALVMAGCVTDQQGQVNRGVEHNGNQALQQETLTRLNDQVQVLQGQVDNLQRELASVKSRAGQAGATASDATATELQQLKAKVAQIEAANLQQKQIILDEVAKQLDSSSRRTGRATAAPTRTSTTPSTTTNTNGNAEQGFEHVIKAGETLSAIAKAYGVSVDAIIKANSIKDPKSLQIGQKLFIPKK